MIDNNKVEIKAGDLVKRTGFVRYADGIKEKVSKKTWLISKVENDKLYYQEKTIDWQGKEIIEDVELKRPSRHGEGGFLVIGDAKKGLKDEYKPTIKDIKIDSGSVQEKYKVLKDYPKYKWKKGDVVAITGKVDFNTLHNGWLEKVGKDTPHKHVHVVVDVINTKGLLN